MRTRNYQSLSNYEIEQYLKKNDILFIPVGNEEEHDPYPVDCEYVQAEAWARLFAEQCDGLFFPGLITFPAGGTENGRGTVQIGMFDAMHYMYTILRSFLRQGFRRLVIVPSHGPTVLFMHPLLFQMMYDCKVPLLMLEPMYFFAQKGLVPGRKREAGKKMYWHFKPSSDGEGLGSHAMMLGAYQICGRLADIPVAGDVDDPEGERLQREGWELNHWFPEHDILNECSSVHAPAPYFYKHTYEHSGFELPATREELRREADAGEAYMRSLISQADLTEHLGILRKLDRYIQDEVMPAVGDHLPENRWSY